MAASSVTSLLHPLRVAARRVSHNASIRRGYAAAAAANPDGIQQGVAYSQLLKRVPEDALRTPELAQLSAVNSKRPVCITILWSLYSSSHIFSLIFTTRRDDQNESFPGCQRRHVYRASHR